MAHRPGARLAVSGGFFANQSGTAPAPASPLRLRISRQPFLTLPPCSLPPPAPLTSGSQTAPAPACARPPLPHRHHLSPPPPLPLPSPLLAPPSPPPTPAPASTLPVPRLHFPPPPSHPPSLPLLPLSPCPVFPQVGATNDRGVHRRDQAFRLPPCSPRRRQHARSGPEWERPAGHGGCGQHIWRLVAAHGESITMLKPPADPLTPPPPHTAALQRWLRGALELSPSPLPRLPKIGAPVFRRRGADVRLVQRRL